MLTREQVLPFLVHEHPAVRAHALGYLMSVAGPRLITGDDLWRAIDELEGEGSLGELQRDLRYVRHTDQSLDRVLGALDDPRTDERFRFHLLLTLRGVDFDVLARNRERILACPQLTNHLRGTLEARLALADVPLDDLWRQMLDYSAANHGTSPDTFQYETADRFVAELARRGVEAAGRAIDYLTIPARGDWAEIWCVNVLEEMRYRPALEKLIEVFTAVDENDELMHEACERAIPAVGAVEAVAPVARLIETGANWTVRLYATGVLGFLREPAAEAALLAVIQDPKQHDLRGLAVSQLVRLCPTGEAFDVLYRMARDGDYERRDVDLKLDLFVLATMTGQRLPELNGWRRHADNVERRSRALVEDAESVFFGPDYRRRVLEGLPSRWSRQSPGSEKEGFDDPDERHAPGDRAPARDVAGRLPDAVNRYYPPVAATIQRDAPKVGRNDPCPCGSGKKYKKCCGA